MQGMYPTGLIVLTAFTKSYLERTIQLDSMPSFRVAGPSTSAPSHRRARAHISHTIEETIELQFRRHTIEISQLEDVAKEPEGKNTVEL